MHTRQPVRSHRYPNTRGLQGRQHSPGRVRSVAHRPASAQPTCSPRPIRTAGRGQCVSGRSLVRLTVAHVVLVAGGSGIPRAGCLGHVADTGMGSRTTPLANKMDLLTHRSSLPVHRYRLIPGGPHNGGPPATNRRETARGLLPCALAQHRWWSVQVGHTADTVRSTWSVRSHPARYRNRPPCTAPAASSDNPSVPHAIARVGLTEWTRRAPCTEPCK